MQCVTVLQSEQCACNCTYVRTYILNIRICPIPPPSHTHTDVAFFRHSLVRYRRQHNQALACPKLKDVGMILVDTNDLREDLLPNPMRCLKVRLSTVLMSVAAHIHTYIHSHSGTCAHTYVHTYAPALLPPQTVLCRYIRTPYAVRTLDLYYTICTYIATYVYIYIATYIYTWVCTYVHT